MVLLFVKPMLASAISLSLSSSLPSSLRSVNVMGDEAVASVSARVKTTRLMWLNW